jgi:hypothetical protein
LVLCLDAVLAVRRKCRVSYWPLGKFDIEHPPKLQPRDISGVWENRLVEGPDGFPGTAREIQRQRCVGLFTREQNISQWNNIVFLMKIYLDKNFRYEMVQAMFKSDVPCRRVASARGGTCKRERPDWRGDYLQFRIRPNGGRYSCYLCLHRKKGKTSSVDRHWVTIAIRFYYVARSFRFAFVMDGKDHSNIVCRGISNNWNRAKFRQRNIELVLYTTMYSVRMSKYMVIFNYKERLTDVLSWYESNITGLCLGIWDRR